MLEASSLSKELAEEIKDSKGKISKSKAVGKLLAKKAVEKELQQLYLIEAVIAIMVEFKP